jgi:hypothetical protein
MTAKEGGEGPVATDKAQKQHITSPACRPPEALQALRAGGSGLHKGEMYSLPSMLSWRTIRRHASRYATSGHTATSRPSLRIVRMWRVRPRGAATMCQAAAAHRQVCER